MFSNRLKDLRKKHRLTQEQLAEIIGVERSSVGKYEGSQGVIPSIEILTRIANYFDTTTDYLLGRTDDEGIKKERPNSEEEQSALKIYEHLIDLGILKRGEQPTKKHLSVLAEVLKPQADFIRFKIEQGE